MEGVTGRGKYIALAVLLLPSLIGMFTFLMLPVISSFVLSFSEWDLIGDIHGHADELTQLLDALGYQPDGAGCGLLGPSYWPVARERVVPTHLLSEMGRARWH